MKYFPALNSLIVLAISLAACSSEREAAAVLHTGLDRLARGEVEELKGKKVGVITNQTGRTADGVHIADVVAQNHDMTLAALFAPEHGIRGKVEGGAKISAERDDKTGAPIFSLYGKTRKPTPEMLAGLDALIFDIQDVGARFYTYISTMSLAMEAAAENGIPFYVLDRPNPIGGDLVEGPVLDLQFRSFVGMHAIPLRHGMTVGELAILYNRQGWLAQGVQADLHVVPMQGWRRGMVFEETGLRWTPPSPNMPTPTTALLYPGVGLLEATNFSEGRGTDSPFEIVGAPWADNEALIGALQDAHLPGIDFVPAAFTPVDMPGKATNPKYEGRLCRGIRFRVLDPHSLQSVALGVHLLVALQRLFPQDFRMREAGMARMTGQAWIYQDILQGKSASQIIAAWQDGLQQFLELRERVLLYSLNDSSAAEP